MEQFSCVRAAIVFVFLVHGTHIYVRCQFSAGIGTNHHRRYTIGQTYFETCFVELPPDDSIANVDTYWNVRGSDYCYNGQKVLINRNYTCNVTIVHNTTYYDLTIPDLTINDGGTYFCKVIHNTKGGKTTFSHNITVIDPSITTTEATTITTIEE
ncbi:uncharacterized protein LOC133188873 isoform X2 [Saccostrea echinata]|uniref:uncharacterized protein LOC133188873 isoform X2 n=1 Tax=Saccostrea echinata TaxID=191078 RepID=UPI002A7FF5CF|nr:uncharacterized protein LOC133188873 isoform X2 [Saccostrea echinata]